jgi:hypothetical protein
LIPQLFTPNVSYTEKWCGAVAIFSSGAIPTVDFYLATRLKNVDPDLLFIFDCLDFDAAARQLPVGTFVVIVRHTSALWLKFIEQYRHLWSGVAFLMDDDIPGAIWCRDIPFDYACWTTKRYLIAKGGLAKVCDRIWLSTDALRVRYAKVKSQLVSPQIFGVLRDASPVGTRRWGYHGTRIHKRELDWLVTVVKRVHQEEPEAEFEVFGNHSVVSKFSGIPRVTVLPTMPWADYVAHCYASNLAVGLAPMLPGRFNQVRSCAKAFDIVRCGAVGVFSISEPYAPLQKCAGVALLQNDQDVWVEEVLNLLRNDALRLSRYEQFLGWIEKNSQDISFESLIG